MIDIHCHILPGIDDGAKTIDDSIDMAKEAVQEGVITIIATPHHKNGQYENETNYLFIEFPLKWLRLLRRLRRNMGSIPFICLGRMRSCWCRERMCIRRFRSRCSGRSS